MKKITFSILFVWLSLSLWAVRQPEFSTAGFFRLDNSGREVERLHKELNTLKLKEVERQQSEFGEKE